MSPSILRILGSERIDREPDHPRAKLRPAGGIPDKRSPSADHFAAHRYRTRNLRKRSAVPESVVTSPIEAQKLQGLRRLTHQSLAEQSKVHECLLCGNCSLAVSEQAYLCSSLARSCTGQSLLCQWTAGAGCYCPARDWHPCNLPIQKSRRTFQPVEPPPPRVFTVQTHPKVAPRADTLNANHVCLRVHERDYGGVSTR